MDTFYEVMSAMSSLDQMRATGEKLQITHPKMGDLAINLCDLGDEVCRKYVKLYKHMRDNPDSFGSTKLKRYYKRVIEPLEERRDAIAAEFKEQYNRLFR
jgi:uncharacterized protein Yka (UPF0111/DUF47 family)